MESQPQKPEFRNKSENFQTHIFFGEIKTKSKVEHIG